MRGRLRHDVDLERQALVVTWDPCCVLYVTIIGINFADPDVQKVQEKGFGLAYFIAIAAAWIAYTEWLGI